MEKSGKKIYPPPQPSPAKGEGVTDSKNETSKLLFEGSLKSNKTDRLIQKYIELINSGVSTCEILVLCSNPAKKLHFIEEVRKNCSVPYLEKLNIYTFQGLAYNIIRDNYCVIENSLNDGKTRIKPHLSGLEISQYLLKQCVKEADFKDYNSKVNLMHQLFKRHALIVNNVLNSEEVKRRSKLIGEAFADDAAIVLNKFKQVTNEFRCYDYIRQLAVFEYIYKNHDCFEGIKYLFVDDTDEATPALLQFIEHIKPNLQDYYIAYDPQGCSRCGYLSASMNAPSILQTMFDIKPEKLEQPANENVSRLQQNITDGARNKIGSIELTSCSKYLEMLDLAFQKVQELIKEGAKPSDFVIISPDISDMLRFYIQEKFANENISFKFLSGSEKLIENELVKITLTIVKLANPQLHMDVDVHEVRKILNKLLGIPLKYCSAILQNYKDSGKLSPFEFANSEYTEKYDVLLKILDDAPSEKALSDKILAVFNKILPFYSEIDKKDIEKFNFFFKQIMDFELTFSEQKNEPRFQSELIVQTENSIFSENPPAHEFSQEFDENTILISTKQKIVDMGIQSKYQIWLDVSNQGWKKEDIGTIYNSWVFQADWDKDSFTYEDNFKYTNEKTARVLRKLLLAAQDKVFAYSSIFDNCGNENYGGILDALSFEHNDFGKQQIFIPRGDQKPVMNYKNGKMAIAAVPGAGKTTVLQGLIIKLLQEGVKAENIFVLTYMESAARNFKERIKNNFKSLNEIPNISTIHGLALRIIKENSNFTKLGLDENFEIIDDIQRQRFVRLLFAKMQIKEDLYDTFERGISIFKLENIQAEFLPAQKNFDLKTFIKFYDVYNKNLLAQNKIDYDDMLKFAVKILGENADIREYYQNLCHYLIEDEAQDSSVIQQRLLELLSGKHKNLIRCGDVNQAITSTFTNADVEGFKEFINNNNCVEMNQSQRCAKDIYTLANNFVEFTKSKSALQASFYDIKMAPVAGKNPKDTESIEFKRFENLEQERNFILDAIKNIFIDNSKATIAVLLRNNNQVQEYINFLEANKIVTIATNGALSQKTVFKVIFSIFKAVQSPFNNSYIAEAFKTLQHIDFYNTKMQQHKPLPGAGEVEFVNDSELASEEFTNSGEGYNFEITEKPGNSKQFIFAEPLTPALQSGWRGSRVGERELVFARVNPSFISLNPDEMENSDVSAFWWDLNYWLDNANIPADELAVKIGLYYFDSLTDKSNVYLVSTLIKKIMSTAKTFDELMRRLEEIAQRSSFNGLKFFEDNEITENNDETKSYLNGKVQILTIHKSKGAEFDYVFMPEFTEKTLPLSLEHINVRKDTLFMEQLRSFGKNYKVKTEQELKLKQIEENARLLYVAVTRAKRKLFMTFSEKYKFYGKLKDAVPSSFFEEFASPKY